MYSLFAIGDLLVWPVQIAAISRLTPARHMAFAVGSWYLTIGIGSWLTAPVGAFGSRSGIVAVAVMLIALGAAAAVALLAMRHWLLRLTAGALDTPRGGS